MSEHQLSSIREIALALPEMTERISHGAPAFFLRDKRPICYFHDADFASDGRVSIWCPAPTGAQAEHIAADPATFFAPTPSSSGVFKDWIGAFLDGPEVDWNDIADVIEDAYRQVAPKKLSAQIAARAGHPDSSPTATATATDTTTATATATERDGADGTLFWDIVDELHAHDQRVVEGTIMGGACVRVDDEFLALVDYKGSGLVVKLPRERVAELVADNTGQPFGPGRKIFKEWISIPTRDRSLWHSLLLEGIDFVSA